MVLMCDLKSIYKFYPPSPGMYTRGQCEQARVSRKFTNTIISSTAPIILWLIVLLQFLGTFCEYVDLGDKYCVWSCHMQNVSSARIFKRRCQILSSASFIIDIMFQTRTPSHLHIATGHLPVGYRAREDSPSFPAIRKPIRAERTELSLNICSPWSASM
jgi:hypothetical protein